ncbi:hypothetical protein N2152v2_008239 [Parachlorella kessleri]
MPGPASLLDISRACLGRYRDCLEDVGFVPLDLLADVLAACSPEQLAQIEDGTLEGSGRDLAPLTWPLWLSHLTFKFGAPPPGALLPKLPDTGEQPADPPEPGTRPAHYRQLYEQRLLELERRREVSGKRLRQLWEQEASERQAKQIQVIDPLARKRPRTAAASPSSSSRGSRYHPGSGSGSQSAGSRDRLLKKLGMGSGKGAASVVGPGLRGAVPAARAGGAPPRIRPVQMPGLVAGRQGNRGGGGGGGSALAALHLGSIGQLAAVGSPPPPRQQPAFADVGRLPGGQRRILAVPPLAKPAGLGLQATDGQLKAGAPAPSRVRPQNQQQQQQPRQLKQQPVRQVNGPMLSLHSGSLQRQQLKHREQQPTAMQTVKPATGGPASRQQAASADEEVLLDEPAWLLPAANASDRQQQQQQQAQLRGQHCSGPGGSAGVQLLNEAAWLPPAAHISAASQRKGRSISKRAIPEGLQSPPASAALLLDEPAWLPTAASKPRPQEAGKQAPSHREHQQLSKGLPSSSKGSPPTKVAAVVAGKAAFVLAVGLSFKTVEARDEFLTIWLPLAKYVREKEPSTLSFELLVADNDPTKVLVYERYISRDAFIDIHRASEPFLAFKKAQQQLPFEMEVKGQSYYETNHGFM